MNFEKKKNGKVNAAGVSMASRRRSREVVGPEAWSSRTLVCGRARTLQQGAVPPTDDAVMLSDPWSGARSTLEGIHGRVLTRNEGVRVRANCSAWQRVFYPRELAGCRRHHRRRRRRRPAAPGRADEAAREPPLTISPSEYFPKR